jgi:CTP:molybdopterin cytidylyltransferase MocA
MGAAKATLILSGTPLLTRHCEALAAAGVEPVVVLGAGVEQCLAVLPANVRWVHNLDWENSWPVDSLRLAIDLKDLSAPLLVTPVDVLPAKPATLTSLLSTAGSGVPCGPDGKPGHPVILDKTAIDRVLAGPVSGGLRTLLNDAHRVAVSDPTVALDFDDPAAWQSAQKHWEERRG